MTFTEAALEVLLSAGEPLHYKKITELAIAGNLLSHVGKTPEVTMSSRLATLVKKDRGQSPIIKVRPGVFALRESAMHTDKDPSTSNETNGPNDDPTIPSAEAKAETVAPERPKIPGADVFPEEADDDFPILAGLEEEPSEDRGRRRRRRRRRGGKPGDGNGADTVPLPDRRNGARPEAREREGSRHDTRSEREGSRFERENARRDQPRGEREARRDEPRGEREVALDFERQPAEGDLLGKDLADAAYHVLARGERMPASFTRVAELLVRRGRLSGSPEALAPTVAAALRADAARAERAKTRARFRLTGQRVSVTEWLLPRDAVRSEEHVEQAAENQRDQVRRAFMARLNDLPAAGFAEMIASWLNAEGVTSLRAVRRPGSSGREFHFAGTLRRGAEESRLAFVVLRSGRDIDRDTVVEARGSLHHYGAATGAWLLTTGRVAAAAREEAGAEGAALCALFGGADLARAMEALGIGIRLHYAPLCDIDFDLLESLGDNVQGGLRRERDDSRRDDAPAREQRRFEPSRDRGQQSSARAQLVTDENELDEEPAARTSTPDAAEAAAPFDLLDPEAAEASRLAPEAQSWSEAEADEEGEEFEQRPTVRMSDAASADEDEVDLDDEPEAGETEADDASAHDPGDEHGDDDASDE